MRIGMVGCGYVADMYLALLANHPILELGGITDRDGDRARRVADTHKARVYDSTRALLDDPEVKIVVNLTNPREHAGVSRLALEAGKHVYSEKPLATDWDEAVALVELAESKGLQLVSAPCTVLGEAAQTAWKAVREGRIGKPLLAYAELDDGMVHRENLEAWLSASGNPWPARDEFEVGCTLEHAGYYVTWLVAMFGPVESVTSFASAQIADKGLGMPLDPPDTPDFSVGCLRFASGIRLAKRTKWTFRAEKRPGLAKLAGLGPRRFPLVRKPTFKSDLPGGTRIDFARGVAELAESIQEGRPCRLSTRYSLHINEIVLTLQDPGGMGSPRVLTSTAFDPMPPMPWAAD